MGNVADGSNFEAWELEIRAAAEELKTVDDFAALLFARIYAEEAELLSFVLREAVLNAVEALANPQSMLKICITAETDALVIRVIDSGAGFVDGWQEHLAKLSMEDCLLSERGRGLLFIRNMVDEIWSESQAKEGHVFGMRKKWRGA